MVFKCEFGQSGLPAGKVLAGVQAMQVVMVWSKIYPWGDPTDQIHI